MNWIPLALVAGAATAQAQEAPTAFPEGAQPLTTEAMKAAVEDRVFTVQPAKGTPWRLQYNTNGYFFINIGNFSDNGKWSARDSTLCTEGRQIRAFCNEFRIKDGDLYMKRENGEVVKFIPR